MPLRRKSPMIWTALEQFTKIAARLAPDDERELEAAE
jgi:hypothetical protein